VKINIILPFDHIEYPDEFLTPEAVVEISTVAERAGFYGGNVTDHPCPASKWLDNGGHYAQDPFVMLSLVAAATKNLRLQTGILVLPYRNPFITARAVATLDVFSRGRVVLGMGAGYLKGEYFALGVDFEQRNELFDEYLKAMKAAWTGEDFSFTGTGYDARNNRMRPAPTQRPHPPLLIGGNSNRAIRRAVELGDAWNPFFAPPQLSGTARTAELADENDLPGPIAYMREYSAKVGRERPPEIILGGIGTYERKTLNVGAFLEKIHKLAQLGISGTAVNFRAKSRREWCDQVEWFGAEVLPKVAAL